MPFAELSSDMHHAIDLVNTVRLEDGRLIDALATPAELQAWLGAHGREGSAPGSPAASPSETAQLLREAHRLRDAVGRVLESFRSGAPVPPDAVFVIDRALAASRVVRRLELAGGRPRLLEHEASPDALAELAPVALGAAELLTSADPRRVRRCASDRCLEWFVDTSKAGRRRWCSMERCGNRAKAAKHRRRRKAG